MRTEKDDVSCPNRTTEQELLEGLARQLGVPVRAHICADSGGGGPLQCVYSGHLSHGPSCGAEIPAEHVRAAWARERLTGARGDRFFRLEWLGETWLAFGLQSGDVRGVYCPEHMAERAGRAVSLQGLTGE